MKLAAFFQNRKTAGRVAQDADGLIAAFGNSAHEQARTRARQARLGQVIDANRPPTHWDEVRREIARRTGREIGLDTATRYLDEKS